MLSVILPAYNEENNIKLAIEEISGFLGKTGLPFELIVVNDGSKDRTSQILVELARQQKNLVVINHNQNLGYGAALRSGFKMATGDLIFFTDSDRQFDIEDLFVFLAKIKEYDFVVGEREKRRDPIHRVLIASTFATLVRLLFGLRVRDVDCAFKLFRKEVIQNIELRSYGALINLEIFALAKKKGYKFSQLPVKHFPRKAGKPTGGGFRVLARAVAGLFPLWLRYIKTK